MTEYINKCITDRRVFLYPNVPGLEIDNPRDDILEKNFVIRRVTPRSHKRFVTCYRSCSQKGFYTFLRGTR